MKILHYKKTKIADAPDELAKAIRRYTKHEAFVSDNPACDCDIIHFHNHYFRTDKRCLIQYHSEPFRVDRTFKGTSLVLDQYHSTLKEYAHCLPVRNVINYEDYEINYIKDKIKIGYSPSVTRNVNQYYDKGYAQTVSIIKKMGVEYDIITGVSLEECINRKTECNIIIDECVTNSFHRSGLEGLGLGKLTICSLGDRVIDNIKKYSSIVPFHNIWINELEEGLKNIINEGINYIIYQGFKSRQWMEMYWSPKDIVKEYINIYKGAKLC